MNLKLSEEAKAGTRQSLDNLRQMLDDGKLRAAVIITLHGCPDESCEETHLDVGWTAPALPWEVLRCLLAGMTESAKNQILARLHMNEQRQRLETTLFADIPTVGGKQ